MKKEMNNKGFSLVELIIVIAIMVILIAVLAPTYLRYVERGRNSRDIQNATAISDAIQVWAADPQAAPALTAADDGAQVVVSATPTCANAQVLAALENAGLTDAAGNFTTTCASRTSWSAYTITVHVAGDGNVSFVYSSTGGPAGAATDAFADMMAGQ